MTEGEGREKEGLRKGGGGGKGATGKRENGKEGDEWQAPVYNVGQHNAKNLCQRYRTAKAK